MPPRRFEYSIGRLERRRQWFLTDDELAGLEPGHDQFLVGRGRCADGHQLDIWTAEQRPIVAISERDEVPGCGTAKAHLVHIRDRQQARPIGQPFERPGVLFEDGSGADDPNAERLAHRSARFLIAAVFSNQSEFRCSLSSRIFRNGIAMRIESSAEGEPTPVDQKAANRQFRRIDPDWCGSAR